MCFRCSKEPSHRDGSFEYPQHVLEIRKMIFNYAYLFGCLYETPKFMAPPLQREEVYRIITNDRPMGLECRDITNGLHVVSLLKGGVDWINTQAYNQKT